jgi:hypothetical protein
MTIETEVSNLTAQAAALLGTINGQKEVLIQRVAAATAQADRAQGQADQVNAGVGAAAGSAAQALAIYGATAAMQAKLDEAKALANAAQTAAASAASVLQQDLSAISAALHRSPNAITAMCIYDLSKDSDGGAWADRMQHTSWMNEPLCGAWRGPLASEAAARAISGAATADYYQLTTDGKFYKLNAGAGVTEVFRGNKAKFPRLAAIVAEAGSVTIYDLTEVGRPMWMRFAAPSATQGVIGWAGTGAVALGAVSALNSVLAIGGDPQTALVLVSFIKDDVSVSTAGASFVLNARSIAVRNATTANTFVAGSAPVIVSSTVNAIAMTVLPDAPVDIATGLQIPTIAVATAGGVSVIKQDGTVGSVAITSMGSSASLTVSFDLYGNVWTVPSGYNREYLITQPYISATLVYHPASVPASSPTSSSNMLVHRTTGNNQLAGAAWGVSRIKTNPATPSRGAVAFITPTHSTGYMLSDIRRAYLCNTEVESVSDVNLVVNGTFDVDAANWGTSGAGTQTWVAGALRRDAAGTASGSFQDVPTVPGKTYNITGAFSLVGGAGAVGVFAYTGGGFGSAAGSIAISGGLLKVQATSATTRIYLYTDGTRVADFDNISVKEVIADRSHKAAAANIFGTLVKTPVAAAAQLVGYSGFSATNYIQEPYSPDLDYGTGEFSFGEWFGTTTAALSTLIDRSAAAGPYYRLGMDATGKLVATLNDGTTTRTVTTPAAYNTGVYGKARVTYLPTGKLGITVNGVEVASVTGAPLLTMNNANAVLTIGNSRTLDAPWPGSITLLKTGATVPTVESSAWMYAQEVQMFREGAQITLPSSGVVSDLDYDESLDRWTGSQPGYDFSFNGLIRTSAAVPSAGSFSKVSTKSGVKLLARTGTSPGVDVVLPAMNLKEELVRRAEAAAKASKPLVPFPFDAIAAQTDFTLPTGWTAVNVSAAGTRKREGATKDYTVIYDGFRETVRFGVAPGAAAWVEIMARKE